MANNNRADLTSLKTATRKKYWNNGLTTLLVAIPIFSNFAVVRKKNISFFLFIILTLAFASVRAASVGQTEDLSSSQKSHPCSLLPLVHSSLEIENGSNYNFVGLHSVKGPKKFTILSEIITALLTRYLAFTSPILNAAGYLHVKKHLSRNYPSHNFW